MDLEQAKLFMDQFNTCVLSTVAASKPQSATVGFSVDDNFDILIATKANTRKAINIANNPNVSVVVGFDGDKTVQIEGVANQIDAVKFADRIDYHFDKVPAARKFAGDESQTYFVIKPNWLRYTDYGAANPVVETENFE